MTLLAWALAAALAAAPKPPPPAAEAAAAGDAWEEMLDAKIPAIVAIRVSGTRSFDTESPSTSVATGFVVDAERGIVLTNRHVVEPGPVVAEAVFLNHEEVPLRAVYRDPIHDFGFYQFDPAALRYMKPVALELVPDHAKVGAEIRVVGNDAGEKISILQGTLARMDRDAPVYGGNRFNDFDTFYYQAASSTSGGSSGSPVLDVHGHAIALNAGGSTRAASSFFLPLDRVKRALDLVRTGQPVTRGTMQTVLRHRPYDEVRRLGLRAETETAVRAALPEGQGLLVVDEVIPGGPAYGKVKVGDVVVKVDGQFVNAFVPIERYLDDHVGGTVKIEVERGGQPLSVEIPVGDLHAITPSVYLEVSAGVVHPVSFQQARNHSVPVASGVYVANPGYALGNGGVSDGAVITQLGDAGIRDLDDFEAAWAALGDGAKVPVRFFDISEPKRERVAVVTVDHRWFPLQRCVRDDTTGTWPCVPTVVAGPAKTPAPVSFEWPVTDRGPGRKLSKSLVWIDFTIPYRVEGAHASRFLGTGVVVDAGKGLVLTDRNTVPIALGDLVLTFAASVQIPAKVLYLHPVHDLAIIQYDPALLDGVEVESAELAVKDLGPGDGLFHVGLTRRQEVAASPSKVRRVEPIGLPIPRAPMFRDTNLEVIDADSGAADGGVLTDKKGRVLALWASFADGSGDGVNSRFFGIPSEVVLDVLEPLRAGQKPDVRSLGVELWPFTMADARDRGLPADQAAKLEEHNPRERQVLVVLRKTAGTPGAGLLEEGDLLVAVNGEPVTTFREVERAVQGASVTATVIRGGKPVDLTVATASLEGRSIDRVVAWAGALVHATPLAASAQRGIEPQGVYVALTYGGSPAARYGLRGTHRIVAVDGREVADLDAFLAAVADRKDRSAVRLEVVDLDGKPSVLTLKLDLQYWPTQELVLGDDGWKRTAR